MVLWPLSKQRGTVIMTSYSAKDPLSGFESELIDVEDVSFRTLRQLNSRLLHQALLHVVQQTERPSKTHTSCSSAAPID